MIVVGVLRCRYRATAECVEKYDSASQYDGDKDVVARRRKYIRRDNAAAMVAGCYGRCWWMGAGAGAGGQAAEKLTMWREAGEIDVTGCYWLLGDVSETAP